MRAGSVLRAVLRPAILTAAALLAGCIERPWEEPQPRRTVDRSKLGDVLLREPPPDMVPVGAVFGNAAELVGYRMEPPRLAPGVRTKMTLYWRARAELDPWHIFVHLDDAQGAAARIHAEHDPAGGRFPTDAWRPGDLIADTFHFVAPRWPLNMYLGFYSVGEHRLPLTHPGRGRDGGGNRLLAATLPLAP